MKNLRTISGFPKGKWKIETKFYGRKNMKKYDIFFTIIPSIAYGTALHNTKTLHVICLVWLFFALDIVFKWEHT